MRTASGRAVLSWTALLACSSLASGAEGPSPLVSQLRFSHVTTDDGLSSNLVRAIAQDHTGFLWFGTYDGLNRYDGSEVVVYRHEAHAPGSLSSSLIESLLVDRDGRLWVGSTGGLDAYDPRTDRFTRFGRGAGGLGIDRAHSLYEDRAGVLWIGTSDGLRSLDRTRAAFTAYRHDPDDRYSLSSDDVRAVVEDAAGVLWVGTNGGGLNRFDRARGTFTTYRHDTADHDSLGNDDVMALAADPDGRLWIGTWGGGLDLFDPGAGRFTAHRHDPADPHSLQDDRVPTVFVDDQGVPWVGTFSGGLNLLDRDRRRFTAYQENQSDGDALQSNRVMHIVQDRTGLVWIATEGGGVHRYDPQQRAFTIYRHDPANRDSIAGNTVWAVHEDPDGIVWIGTHGRGLDRLDRRTGRFTHYPPDPGNPRALGFPTVIALHRGGPRALWIGTYGGGLYRLDPGSGVFTAYRHDPANAASLSHDSVTALGEDASGRLWIATQRGLNSLDQETGRFTVHPRDPSDPGSLGADVALAIDRRGKVWTGGYDGVHCLDPASGRTTHYRHDPGNADSLSSDDVHVMGTDRSGMIWIGTFGGVANRLDPETGRVTRYPGSATAGHVSRILDEAPGTNPPGMWIVQSRALSRVDLRNGALRTYGRGHGVPAMPFARSGVVGRAGELLLGTTRGLLVVDPAALKPHQQALPVVLTGLLLANQPVPIGGASVLQQSLDHTPSLTLSHRERVVSFRFAALDYHAPAESRYRYKLEGFDTDWNEVDATRRLATYTNLDTGRYLFRVTAANDDGVWNEDGRAIALVITPPWWGTAWFRVVALLAVVCAALGAHRWRTLALRERHRALEREIFERREVEQALRHTHARVQELAGQLIVAQEQERRRIARELHDDVNQQVAALSIALSALGTRLPDGVADLRGELARLEANAQALSEAVRGLSHGLHPAVLEHAGLVPALRGFCREQGGGYELTLSFPEEIEPLPSATALCLYRAAQEALRNVAKHAGAEHVRVAIERENGHLLLTVGDDGCGFEVADARSRGGLGLVSLEERARLVGGRVSITSRPRQGTEVRLLVPL